MPQRFTYPPEITLINGDYKAVSMNAALDTGVANIYTDPNEQGTRIDLTTDSPGKREIDRMLANCMDAVRESPTLSGLLKKPEWSQQDRELWEEGLSAIARDQIFDSPRFGDYRHEDNQKPTGQLSITDVTKDTWFHCELMTAANGILIQKMENQFLQPSDDGSIYKQRIDYYMSGGQLYTPPITSGRNPKGYREGVAEGNMLHGYLLSPLTGNYIECTTGRNGWLGQATPAYNRSRIEGYDFDDFLAGFPFNTDKSNITEGFDGTPQAAELANDRRHAIAIKDYDFLKTHTADGQYDRYRQSIFTDERNLLLGMSDPKTVMSVDILDAVGIAVDTGKKSGRTYAELIRDAGNPDFAMTDEELERAANGNRLTAWAINSPGAFLAMRNMPKTFGGKTWDMPDLLNFIESRGMEDICIERPLARGTSFDQALRAAYALIPAARMQIPDDKGGQTTMTADQYISMCRQWFVENDGKLADIDKPGTMVPTLMNPSYNWKQFSQRNGRDELTFEKEELPANVMTTVIIKDLPGTVRDSVDMQIHSVLNGLPYHHIETASLAVTGQLRTPTVPQPVTATGPAPATPPRG